MADHFIDERLCEHVSYGFVATRAFLTTVAEVQTGFESRNAERSRPIHTFTAPYNSIKPAHTSIIVSAHAMCLGRYGSFRFKDWSDYQLTDALIGYADGTTDQELQIIQPRMFGGGTGLGRIITKPVDSTKYNRANGYVEDSQPLTVKADGTPITASVDYDTGKILITATSSAEIRVSCDFDVPVRFMNDELSLALSNYQSHNLEVKLKEDWTA